MLVCIRLLMNLCTFWNIQILSKATVILRDGGWIWWSWLWEYCSCSVMLCVSGVFAFVIVLWDCACVSLVFWLILRSDIIHFPLSWYDVVESRLYWVDVFTCLKCQVQIPSGWFIVEWVWYGLLQTIGLVMHFIVMHFIYLSCMHIVFFSMLLNCLSNAFVICLSIVYSFSEYDAIISCLDKLFIAISCMVCVLVVWLRCLFRCLIQISICFVVYEGSLRSFLFIACICLYFDVSIFGIQRLQYHVVRVLFMIWL